MGMCGSAGEGSRAVCRKRLLPAALPAQGSHIHEFARKNHNQNDDDERSLVVARLLPFSCRWISQVLWVTADSSPARTKCLRVRVTVQREATSLKS